MTQRGKQQQAAAVVGCWRGAFHKSRRRASTPLPSPAGCRCTECALGRVPIAEVDISDALESRSPGVLFPQEVICIRVLCRVCVCSARRVRCCCCVSSLGWPVIDRESLFAPLSRCAPQMNAAFVPPSFVFLIFFFFLPLTLTPSPWCDAVYAHVRQSIFPAPGFHSVTGAVSRCATLDTVGFFRLSR